MCFEILERSTVKLYQSLADDRLILAMSSLHVHHLGDRHTACNPFISRFGQIGNLGEVSCVSILDQHECVVSERIAVIRVEVGRECASSFITEEMMEGRILAAVGSCCLSLCKLGAYQSGEQFLGLDQGNLHIAVRISVKEQLLLDGLRKDREDFHGLLREAFLDECILGIPVRKCIELCCLASCKKLVDLSDQDRELRNEFDNTLRDDDNAKVHAFFCSLCHRVSDLVCDLGQGHLLFRHFLRDQADVRLCFQCALKCNMGSTATHDLDEVPVLLRGVAVSLDIADQLTVCLGSRIKSEGSLDIFILQIAVDGLRASDDLNACIMCSHVLSKNRCIGIGVVAADDNDSSDAMLLADLSRNCELLLGLQFGSAGADDIKTAGVPELINVLIFHDDVVVLKESARAALESIQYIVLVGCLQRIIQTADNIVSAGSLSAGQDNAYNLLLIC